jgi:hypothetical protein
LNAQLKFLGQWTRCKRCGHPLQVPDLNTLIPAGIDPAQGWGENVRLGPSPAAWSVPQFHPALTPAETSWQDALPPTRSWKVAFLVCVPMVVVGLSLIGWLTWSLESERREAAAVEGNKTVAELVQRAESAFARRQWDQTENLLNQALATEDATDLDRAEQLLGRTRAARADRLLVAAELAISHKKTGEAQKLLQEYLTCPGASEKERVAGLLDEMALALSDARAVSLLKDLPEAQFAAFVQGGKLNAIGRLSNPYLRQIYEQTLRRNMARAAAARKDELAKRVAKAQSTPAYREVQEFAARTRKKHQDFRGALKESEDKLLEASAAGLAGNNGGGQNPAALRQEVERRKQQLEQEQKQFRAWQEAVEGQVSHLRAGVKERIRTYKGYSRADWLTFDSLVDGELDRLVTEIKKSDGDDVGND